MVLKIISSEGFVVARRATVCKGSAATSHLPKKVSSEAAEEVSRPRPL